MASSNLIGPKLRYASPLTIAITAHQTPVRGFARLALPNENGKVCLCSQRSLPPWIVTKPCNC